MSPRRRTARLLALVPGLALVVLLAGCVGLPRSGPVVETSTSGDSDRDNGVTYDPLPPLPDASPAEIVEGFLDAMTAIPIQTTSAAEFLTQEARASWRPERQTITYAERGAPVGSSTVVVRVLDGGHRFDGRGAWQGPLPGEQPQVSFELQVEDGEWRIARAPDALVVPESWFEGRFRRQALYFYDPSARILVPEPVFVANDDALATRLVQGLLVGPGPRAEGTSRTFFPPGTRALAVPVSDSGVADISLVDVQRPTADVLRLMVVQLAWTLRQVRGVESFRLTIDGEPFQPAEGEVPFPVDTGEEYDPAGHQASSIVFGLREGRLVGGILGALDPVEGPFGTADAGLRSVGVDLGAELVAGVSEDGGSVLVAPVFDGGPGEVQRVFDGGVDLLPPAWDFADRMWLVDRGAGSAQVLHREGGVLLPLEVPGITGARVRSFLVSRDGSRLVAVVRKDGRDQLRVSRVSHDDQGNVVRATRARLVSLDAGDEVRQVRDLAWASPTTVGVLTRVGGALWEVRTVSVDGAPASLESIATLNNQVRSLAGSPVEGQGLVVLTDQEALDLSASTADPVPVDPSVGTLDFVG